MHTSQLVEKQFLPESAVCCVFTFSDPSYWNWIELEIQRWQKHLAISHQWLWF